MGECWIAEGAYFDGQAKKMKNTLPDVLGANVRRNIVPALAIHFETLKQEEGFLIRPLIAQVLQGGVDFDEVVRVHVGRILP